MMRRDSADFRSLRGIEDEAIYGEHAAHSHRPHEIFAEDFRFLFGGPMANTTAASKIAICPCRMRSPACASSSCLWGRSPWSLRRAGSSQRSPNPFNPRTWVSISAESTELGAPLTVQVFDAGGRMVRSLHEAGSNLPAWISSGRTDDAGREMPAGVYFSLIRLGTEETSAR